MFPIFFSYFVSLRVGQLKVPGGEDGLDTGTGGVPVRFPCTARSDQRAELAITPTWVPLQVGGGAGGVDVHILILPGQKLHWGPEAVTVL